MEGQVMRGSDSPDMGDIDVEVRNEETILHTVFLKPTKKGYKAEARVIFHVRIDGVDYACNKVIPVSLRKEKAR